MIFLRSNNMNNYQSNIPLSNRLIERVAPDRSPVMYQRWDELLFLHWSVDISEVSKHLPPGLRVDTFNGKAWVGIVPFTIRRVRPRFLPAVAGLSNFPELNLRTYVVDDQGRPGVWFFSLDTPKRIPNWIARTFFHLNYRQARMRVKMEDSTCIYRSELRDRSKIDQTQEYAWKRQGKSFLAELSGLGFFLVERYRLFAYSIAKKRLLTGRVHHEPYMLQSVELARYTKSLFDSNALGIPSGEPISVLASAGVDVRIFPMEIVG